MSVNIKFDKATYLSLIFKFILSEGLSNSLWGWDVLLFLELINVVPVLFYNVLEFIILFDTFLVICFARYKEYVICLIPFSKFSYLFPVFTCVRVIGNLWKTCLGVDILGPFPCFTSYLALDAIVV